ncbi:thymidine phosphorylase [Lichenihabitans psoromatis]|uniref:thymidine phosphorylase n=1 Tax=Lichenihabitans psoromatis TaxID=2528642 RepID=UPI0010385051|nr:thymidine phosphorylase [Lichenihabitans psoromatis]
MLPQEIIRKKRDGRRLDAAEITAFMAGLSSGAVTGEQAAAFAMAVFLRGMDPPEIVALTAAMTASGRTLTWSDLDLPGPVVDKHSTGGVGDNVSLMLAPLVAACGGFVPMISGRGLGHSGGTLDKLDSIPGYDCTPDLVRFRSTVQTIGCAIIGQTADLAPADRHLYAIRDVTATVESIPLITASILSKKIAAGLGALVMDVKTGSGAFMSDLASARALATSIVAVANGAGLPTTALITDMNEPLASAAGNALEIHHAIRYLTGATRETRLHEVVLALGSELLVTSKIAGNLHDARARLETALGSGQAAERFSRMVAALGGPHDLLERPGAHLIDAPIRLEVMAARSGYVQHIETRALGLAVVALGGGRTRPGDTIDHRVGFDRLAPIGAIMPDMPLGIVHAADDDQASHAAEALRRAYRIGDQRPALAAPVIERIS